MTPACLAFHQDIDMFEIFSGQSRLTASFSCGLKQWGQSGLRCQVRLAVLVIIYKYSVLKHGLYQSVGSYMVGIWLMIMIIRLFCLGSKGFKRWRAQGV